MNKKTLYATGGMLLALLVFGGIAAVVIGPYRPEVQRIKKGLAVSSSNSQTTGCNQSTTSTDCSKLKNTTPPEPELSTATTYSEVASTQQSGKIDNHLTINNTLKGISFCKTSFKTRQVFINGVDVGQRIAQLASSDAMGKLPNSDSLGQGICDSLPRNVTYTKGILEIPDVTTLKTEAPRAPENNYLVIIGKESFAVNPLTNEIFIVSAYDGSTLTRVGKLK